MARSLKKGHLSTMAGLKRRLRELPTTVAHDVAQKATPAMTGKTQRAFASSRTVYGDPRPLSTEGAPLRLEKTGLVKAELRFRVTGRVIRCVLPADKRGVQYARYLIGRYGILPNGPLPAEWSRTLGQIVDEADGGLKK